MGICEVWLKSILFCRMANGIIISATKIIRPYSFLALFDADIEFKFLGKGHGHKRIQSVYLTVNSLYMN